MVFCCFPENARFDASQYAFFGDKNILEEVELGGLEDDEDGNGAGIVRPNDEEYLFSTIEDREEVTSLHKASLRFTASLLLFLKGK